jgi:glycosyltransferase involved in cell wall biosynthesis
MNRLDREVSPMRILKVVQSYFPFEEKGGTVFKVRALARALAGRGNSVSILTADLGLGRTRHGLELESHEWGWRANVDGIPVVYLSTAGHYRALTFNPNVIDFSQNALGRFEIVHFYGLYDLLGPSVSYFCRRRSLPYVVEPMGMFRPIDRGFRLKRLWHRALGRPFLRGAAEMVATSELEQQEFLDDGIPASKVVLRYNGIDPESFADPPSAGLFRAAWNIPADEPLIVFLSRLIPRKGADMLIRVFARVCAKGGRLVIAGPEGEAGYREYLERCAREAGCAERVVFTGAIYRDEKKALLRDADIFVLASRYENFANVVAEAIAYDVPVIVSNTCGIHSLVQGRAGIVISPEEGALAAALERFLADEAFYLQCRAGCREVVRELGWDRLSGQMEGFYRQALGTGDRGLEGF